MNTNTEQVLYRRVNLKNWPWSSELHQETIWKQDLKGRNPDKISFWCLPVGSENKVVAGLASRYETIEWMRDFSVVWISPHQLPPHKITQKDGTTLDSELNRQHVDVDVSSPDLKSIDVAVLIQKAILDGNVESFFKTSGRRDSQ